MRVLYDHQIFTSQRFGGISRYFSELIKQFDRSHEVDAILPFFYSRNQHLRGTGRFIFGLPFRRGQRILEDYLTAKPCLRALRAGGFDLLHPTYFEPYFFDSIGRKPFVLTVHDTIAERFGHDPAVDPQAGWKAQVLPKARALIAISEATKRDVIDTYNIPGERIHVIYHGGAIHSVSTVPTVTPDRFLLYVGARWHYKNFLPFVEAAAAFLGRGLALLCVGGGNFTPREKVKFNELKVSSYVYQMNAADRELAYIYRRAVFFVLPSLYEGFGIPIIEAMSCGCPVVAGNTSSIPEVGGDAIAYFDPKNIESMRSVMSAVLNDVEYRKDLVLRGRNQANKFSWERCARETAKIYRSIIAVSR